MKPRRPRTEDELREWLRNMVWYHRYGDEEISDALGLTLDEVAAARRKFDITPNNRPERPADAPLLVLPYPGGRHPRSGFLEGAVDPQRETKFSVFAAWDESSYAVVDVPEAIFSNLGLIYLAHVHVPTLWSRMGIDLEPLEWTRRNDGGLEIERTLPNGIRFGTRVVPTRTELRMELSLTNGTEQPLTDLRVQNCVLLRGLSGFELQTNDNKVLAAPYAAARASRQDRWILTAWDPCHRVWANPDCPCFHSDPRFPDCPPGETRRVRGWLSFYEGKDIQAEFRRVDTLGWRDG